VQQLTWQHETLQTNASIYPDISAFCKLLNNSRTHTMNKFIGLGAATLTVLGSAVMSADPAQALEGGFQIFGGNNNGPTLLEVSEDELNFTPNRRNIFATSGTGSFTGFGRSSIFDVTSLLSATVRQNGNPGGFFIDLGTNGATAVDGVDGFTANSFSAIKTEAAGALTNLTVHFSGLFDIGGETADGEGTLTFQAADSLTNVESILASGGSLSGLTFSGAALTVADVPEPATMLGLGVVAGAGFLASRRKQAEA
jgi:hypothetical protein